ncbi:hypothetical protein GCM10017784_34940 [Deinococcus indicus]|uniref:hypothetical protein n=1 Tax=Deinococcus indicus TaxID=223556 RepID=UPI00174BC01C|nr:hypothetical protein [Deinococcus indicus]GHG37559.1 hypothetical protein GCM10017784_34940 [Deinococcus indicus]
MKQLTLQDGSGNPITSWDFGEVPTGQQSAPLAITLRNTGDEPLTGITASVSQGSSADGELRVTLAGAALTATPTSLPDLAPGAGHAGTATYIGPSIPVDSGTLRWTAS